MELYTIGRQPPKKKRYIRQQLKQRSNNEWSTKKRKKLQNDKTLKTTEGTEKNFH